MKIAKAGRRLLRVGRATIDALNRGILWRHFREEHQTKEGEALRNDGEFNFVSTWEYNKEGRPLYIKRIRI